MNEYNITNNINVSGENNTVNFNQQIGSDEGKQMEMVFKFLLTVLMLPVTLPLLLLMNRQNILDDDGQDSE